MTKEVAHQLPGMQAAISEAKWRRILVRLEKASCTAKRSTKGRVEVDGEFLEEIAAGLRAALDGRPPLAFRERHPDDRRPRETFHVRKADAGVQYMLAARENLIVDPAPNKTVREALGVDAQTVRDWVNAEEANPGLATARMALWRAVAAGPSKAALARVLLMTLNPEGYKSET